MTKEELIVKLKEPPADPEDDHAACEGYLLDFINDEKILDAWLDRKDRGGWWYA
jgi:hypothetical protein